MVIDEMESYRHESRSIHIVWDKRFGFEVNYFGIMQYEKEIEILLANNQKRGT